MYIVVYNKLFKKAQAIAKLWLILVWDASEL